MLDLEKQTKQKRVSGIGTYLVVMNYSVFSVLTSPVSCFLQYQYNYVLRWFCSDHAGCPGTQTQNHVIIIDHG